MSIKNEHSYNGWFYSRRYRANAYENFYVCKLEQYLNAKYKDIKILGTHE